MELMNTLSYAIGVDIGGTKTAVSLWTFDGSLKKKDKFATEGSAETVIARITTTIERLIGDAEIGRNQVLAIGISCGGPLDSDQGLILSPPNLPGWDNIPVVRILEENTGIRCFLENDANACALAEWYWGAGYGYRNMIFLTFGTGLGAGLILNNQLYRGTCDLAGEIGHIRLADDGPSGYGKNGSWEGFCSGGGISRMYASISGREESGKYVCDAAASGDPVAKGVIDRSATYLGRGIALLIDILNPECIVIGSIFARNENLFRTMMESVIAREALNDARKKCVIVPAQLGELLGDRAALGVAIDGMKNVSAPK